MSKGTPAPAPKLDPASLPAGTGADISGAVFLNRLSVALRLPMQPKDIVATLSSLPWQQIVPLIIDVLKGIDLTATNPFEKFVIETAIGLLSQLVPPAPTPGA